MFEYIEREAAVKAAQDGADEWDGGYNRNRDIYVEAAIDKVPAADVVSKSEYDKLLAAAKAMHTWIFLNTVDEFEVYDECGLTDEMNALLGSMGRFELKQEVE